MAEVWRIIASRLRNDPDLLSVPYAGEDLGPLTTRFLQKEPALERFSDKKKGRWKTFATRFWTNYHTLPPKIQHQALEHIAANTSSTELFTLLEMEWVNYISEEYAKKDTQATQSTNQFISITQKLLIATQGDRVKHLFLLQNIFSSRDIPWKVTRRIDPTINQWQWEKRIKRIDGGIHYPDETAYSFILYSPPQGVQESIRSLFPNAHLEPIDRQKNLATTFQALEKKGQGVDWIYAFAPTLSDALHPLETLLPLHFRGYGVLFLEDDHYGEEKIIAQRLKGRKCWRVQVFDDADETQFAYKIDFSTQQKEITLLSHTVPRK